MEAQGLTFFVDPLNTQGATIKFKGDANKVVTAFQDELCKRLQKKGLVLLTPGIDPENAHVRISPRIVQIDEGNRALRYFLTFFAGHAVFEVEGQSKVMDLAPLDLYHRARQAGGLFGGSSDGLLVLCAKSAAGKFAGETLKALKNR